VAAEISFDGCRHVNNCVHQSGICEHAQAADFCSQVKRSFARSRGWRKTAFFCSRSRTWSATT